MDELITIFNTRGDLAHVAALLWALSATALAWFSLRELAAASRRFDDFVASWRASMNSFANSNPEGTDGHAASCAARSRARAKAGL